jgi:hypothetical protein
MIFGDGHTARSGSVTGTLSSTDLAILVVRIVDTRPIAPRLDAELAPTRCWALTPVP